MDTQRSVHFMRGPWGRVETKRDRVSKWEREREREIEKAASERERASGVTLFESGTSFNYFICAYL